jgi:hypothetical protein
MNTKQIIDYAAEDNAKDMRDALYAGIHDRVMQHIDTKKQEIAQNLFAQSEQPQDTDGENS